MLDGTEPFSLIWAARFPVACSLCVRTQKVYKADGRCEIWRRRGMVQQQRFMIRWSILLSVHHSLSNEGSLSCAHYTYIPYLNILEIWISCNLLRDLFLFLRFCPSIQHKRSCCSSLCCLLMMLVYGWGESSIWSRPLENKMSIRLPSFPEYQHTILTGRFKSWI